MDRTTLGNRPVQMPPTSRIEDFTDGTNRVRVSLKLLQASPDVVLISAQAFEVDANGFNLPGPDGRPSRTPDTTTTIIASSLGHTHTLQPGWVLKLGTYTQADFTVIGKPEGEGAVGDEYFDQATQRGYRWDEGETLRIARDKAEEMVRILANSPALAGISF